MPYGLLSDQRGRLLRSCWRRCWRRSLACCSVIVCCSYAEGLEQAPKACPALCPGWILRQPFARLLLAGGFVGEKFAFPDNRNFEHVSLRLYASVLLALIRILAMNPYRCNPLFRGMLLDYFSGSHAWTQMLSASI